MRLFRAKQRSMRPSLHFAPFNEGKKEKGVSSRCSCILSVHPLCGTMKMLPWYSIFF